MISTPDTMIFHKILEKKYVYEFCTKTRVYSWALRMVKYLKISQYNPPYLQSEEESHDHYQLMQGKSFEKIQYPFTIKSLRNKEKLFDFIKHTYRNLQLTVCCKTGDFFFLKWGAKQVFYSYFLFYIVPETLVSALRWRMEGRKEERKEGREEKGKTN